MQSPRRNAALRCESLGGPRTEGHKTTAMTPAPKQGRRRVAAPPGIPVRNSVLAGLLAADYQHVLAKLEHVTLTGGQVLYHADQEIEDVYFPEDAVVAMIDAMDDGRTVEVGIIGLEGFVGINVFLGGVVTPDKQQYAQFQHMLPLLLRRK